MDFLLPHQIEHTDRLISILKKKGIAIDGSGTGKGKTFVQMAIGKILDLKLFIICNISNISYYRENINRLGIECIGYSNYESIRTGKYYKNGNVDHRSDCPYVTITEEGKIPVVNWSFPSNTLVVIDEMHKAKNGISSTKQSQISRIIVSMKNAINMQNKVYLLLASATISDSVNTTDVLLYLLDLYSPYNKRQYDYYINRLGNSEEAQMKRIKEILYPTYGSSMPNDGYRNLSATAYKVDESIAKQICEYHKLLGQLVSTNKTLEYEYRMNIELLKVPTVVKEAQDYVAKGKSVVIFVNYTNTRELLHKSLTEYPIGDEKIITNDRIGSIHGGQKQSERDENIAKFQSEQKYVMICQIKAGGQSLSLHDINGVRQRVSLIFPTYEGINFIQLLGRIDREASKSEPIQKIVYCYSDNQNYNIELKILERCNDSIKRICGLHGNGNSDLNIIQNAL